MARVKARLVPSDQMRGKSAVGMWWWPEAWGNALPDDALTQVIAALKTTGAGKVGDIVNGAIRKLMATAIWALAAPNFTDCTFAQSTDKIVLDVLTEDGTVTDLELFGAPQNGILKSNGRDVDMDQLSTLALALTTGGVCNLAGQEFKKVVGGYRDSRPAVGSRPGGE